MEKEVLKVSTKAEEAKDYELEVYLPEDTVTMELPLNKRDCVVL